MKSSPAAAAVVAARGGGAYDVSGGCGAGKVKWPKSTSADAASGARCAASCAVIEPNDQPKRTGGPATPLVFAIQRAAVMTSAAARSGVSHPDESRGVAPYPRASSA